MRAYEALSERGQIQRLRQLAQRALASYPLTVERVSLIYHGENTTFCARVARDPEVLGDSAHLAPDRVLVRCHRPHYNSRAEIGAELEWLHALSDAQVPVQLPLRNSQGEYVTPVQQEGVPAARSCTVLRWSTGRFVRAIKPVHFERVGALTARLHAHARGWEQQVPRRQSDPSLLLGNVHREPHDERIWEPFDDTQRAIQEAGSQRVRALFEALGEQPRILLHHDLHMRNVLFSGGQARPIDFDDCAYGLPAQDVAITMSYQTAKPDYATYLAAYLGGYKQAAGEGVEGMEYYNDFLIARAVQFSFWIVERARDVPNYRALVPGWLERNCAHIESWLKTPLGDGEP